MRKFLLSILSIIGVAFAANADTVTFDFVNNDYGMERLSGTTQKYNADGTVVSQDGCPVIITLNGNTRLWNTGGMRFYTKSKFTVSAPGYIIKSVTFGTSYASFNYNDTKLTAAKWTGSEESVTFACNITKSNKSVNTLEIEYEKAGDPTKEDAGLEYKETAFTIDEGQEFTAPALVNPNGLAVSYSSSDEAVATVAADGSVTVKGVGMTTITAVSAATDKYNEGKASYTITVVAVLRDAADVYTLKDGEKFVLVEPVTVFYVNGRNVFASGAKRNVLLYDGDTYPMGTVITRLEGVADVYEGLMELTKYTATTAADKGTIISPKAMKAADITEANVNDYIVLEGADITAYTASKKNGTISQDGSTIALRNNFGAEVEVANNLKITGIVCIYNGTLQVQPTAIVDVASGIDNIEADNAPAEYFNLQGVSVDADTKGLLIRRQGGKTTKVIVK